MDVTLLDEWRAAAERLPNRGRGRRYPTEMRTRAVELTESAVAAGMRKVEVYGRLGIPDVTLNAWRRAGCRSLVPVQVIEAQADTVRFVVGAGHANLTVEQLALLLRTLS